MDANREGYIIDFISGLQVKESPEEIDAVQPFSKILVDDYGYPKSHIHTRPQYRVKVRPSDKKKNIPLISQCSPAKFMMKIVYTLLLSVKRRIEEMVEASLKIICVFQKHILVSGLMAMNVFICRK